ncbi:aminoglycoside phosphotransferase family protein [Candidatus Enterococcus ferrettii]|uniref:Aminoglycoside phosphotransferase domain-containing protein n=1 Tax=Candidatus Enterococcus ferrettii TaxID=2815324 RepID=A0ABV0EQK6_9ENTE|nr:aminoglycoside phosphotransferase family protein [Enterococcus sp. 665A]MBO1339766.1 aminoglycoside phosphotransferase family protein [Enterococcus sp. 665A]
MKLTREEQVQKLAQYLAAGEYFSAEEDRIFFLENQMNHPMIAGKYKPENSQRVLISEQKVKQFSGTILWFTSSGEIKIFSEDTVLILCSSKASYQKKIQHYNYFSPFFSVPLLQQRNAEKLQLIEERIDFRRIATQDDPLILKTIYQDYTRYFLQQRTMAAKHSVAEFLAQPNERLEKLVKEIQPDLLTAQFPFLMLHGDLWTENILLEKENENLWYIDWDTAGEYLFFHDFFKFMWNEVDVHANHRYYQAYLAGEYDEAFARIFGLFQLEFQPEYRKDYFYLFFLGFMLAGDDSIADSWKQIELVDFLEKIVLN